MEPSPHPESDAARAGSTAAPALLLRSLDDTKLSEVEQFLALYRDAIPLRERKPETQLLHELRGADHRADVMIQDRAVFGFIVVYGSNALCLLEYMATLPWVRGRGLGADLYRSARTAAGSRPLLVEVESDEEDCPDLELRRRRLGFYRREGARVVDGLDYLLPLPGEGPPPRLKLLVDNWPAADVERDTLAAWLGETYARVYGMALADPRLNAMSRALPSRVRLI